jgi:hypothetical protein
MMLTTGTRLAPIGAELEGTWYNAVGKADNPAHIGRLQLNIENLAYHSQVRVQGFAHALPAQCRP